MASVVFHNNTVSINDTWYESHAHLVRMIALELGKPDKVPELLEKFLGTKMKIKAMRVSIRAHPIYCQLQYLMRER